MASSATAGDDADGYHSATSAEVSHSSGILYKRDYLYLGETHCRCTMTVRVGEAPIQVVCFRTTARCGYHLRQRTEDEGRLPVGGYLAFQPPGKTQVYGLPGSKYLTPEEYESLNDPVPQPPESTPTPSVNSGVHPRSPAPGMSQPDASLLPPDGTEPSEGLDGETPEESSPPDVSRRGVSFSKTQSRSAPPPYLVRAKGTYYGLTDPSEHRYITRDLTQATQWCSEHDMQVVRTFPDRRSAQQWRMEEVMSISSDSEPMKRSPRKNKKVSKPSNRHQSKSKRHSRHHSSSSEDDSSSLSSSVSSDSSSSSESSSSESSLRRASRRRVPKKKSARRKSYQGSSRNARLARRILGTDDSTGNEDKIHKMGIDSDKLLQATGPPDMSPKEIDKIYDYAVDVVSLPGRYQITDLTTVDDVEKFSGIMSAALHRGKTRRGDPLWNTASRHPLGGVKSRDGFTDHIENVSKSRKGAFKQQQTQIRNFLRQQGYSSKDADVYISSGGLIYLVNQTYSFYTEFLQHVQALAYKSSGSWKGTQAQTVLSHYSDKLQTIRCNAVNKRDLLLRSYACLRDARHNSYSEISFVSKMWQQVDSSSVNPPASLAGPPSPDKEGSTCSHCRLPSLHVHLGKPMNRNSCPLKDHDSKIARKAAKILLKLKCEDPSAALKDLVAKAVSQSE